MLVCSIKFDFLAALTQIPMQRHTQPLSHFARKQYCRITKENENETRENESTWELVARHSLIVVLPVLLQWKFSNTTFKRLF
jgi:hypothetical protein